MTDRAKTALAFKIPADSGEGRALTTKLESLEDRAGNQPRASHAALLTGAQLSRGFFRLLFVLAVARALGPRQFGVYALMLAIVEMLAVASGTGYADYLTREAAKDARVGWGLGEQLTWLRLACAIPLAAAALGVLWVLGYPRLVLEAVAWLSLSLAPRSISENVQGVLRGISRYVSYIVVELIFDLTLLSGAIFIFIQRGTLSAVIATEIMAASAAAIVSVIFVFALRTKERIHLSGKQLVEKSAVFNLYAFVTNLYDRLDVVLLSKLAGDYATGVYSAAYRPLGTFQLVPYGVLYSLLPALTRNPGGMEERLRLQRAMGLLLSASFGVVLITMTFADPAVHLFLGNRYADSAAALKILICAVIFRYINYGLNVRLLADCHERVFVVTSLVCLGVNVAGNLLLIPIYSWRAAAVLTIVTELTMLAQNVYWLRRIVGVIPRPTGWLGSTLVFLCLLVASHVGAGLAPPLVIGSACVLLFMVYLFKAGMIGEFAAVWRT